MTETPWPRPRAGHPPAPDEGELPLSRPRRGGCAPDPPLAGSRLVPRRRWRYQRDLGLPPDAARSAHRGLPASRRLRSQLAASLPQSSRTAVGDPSHQYDNWRLSYSVASDSNKLRNLTLQIFANAISCAIDCSIAGRQPGAKGRTSPYPDIPIERGGLGSADAH